MVEIRAAQPSDRDAVAGALASAFSEDPLMRWMTADAGPIEERLLPMFAATTAATLRHADHLVFVAEDGSGAAIWKPVGKWKASPADMLRVGPGAIRTFGLRRVFAAVGALSAIEKAHPTEPHYYLEMLGTRVDRQSKGVGSAMIGAMLERCDAERVPAYLESSNPQNIPFYARHGFDVTGEIVVGKGAPTVTAMWRDPRG